MDDCAAQAKRPGEHLLGELYVPFAHRVTHARGRNAAVLPQHAAEDLDVAVVFAGNLPQERDIAVAQVAKVHVRTDRESATVQLAAQPLAGKDAGWNRSERRIKVQHKDVIDAELGKIGQPSIERVDRRRRAFRSQQLERMWLKCHDDEITVQPVCLRPQMRQKRAVTDVQTVEIAKRDRRRPRQRLSRERVTDQHRKHLNPRRRGADRNPKRFVRQVRRGTFAQPLALLHCSA